MEQKYKNRRREKKWKGYRRNMFIWTLNRYAGLHSIRKHIERLSTIVGDRAVNFEEKILRDRNRNLIVEIQRMV